VAPLIVWLSSEQSADVTGQAMGIGGDRLALYSHLTSVRTVDHEGGWVEAAIHATWRTELASLQQRSDPPELS
jgi:3-oxoacyl-[acyl-carrier protein] reductase